MIFASGSVTEAQLLRLYQSAEGSEEVRAPMFYCVHCDRLMPLVYEVVERHIKEQCRGDN